MRMPILLAAAMTAGSILPAAAECNWSGASMAQSTPHETKMTVAEVPVSAEPVQVVLTDAWLERMIG